MIPNYQYTKCYIPQDLQNESRLTSQEEDKPRSSDWLARVKQALSNDVRYALSILYFVCFLLVIAHAALEVLLRHQYCAQYLRAHATGSPLEDAFVEECRSSPKTASDLATQKDFDFPCLFSLLISIPMTIEICAEFACYAHARGEFCRHSVIYLISFPSCLLYLHCIPKHSIPLLMFYQFLCIVAVLIFRIHYITNMHNPLSPYLLLQILQGVLWTSCIAWGYSLCKVLTLWQAEQWLFSNAMMPAVLGKVGAYLPVGLLGGWSWKVGEMVGWTASELATPGLASSWLTITTSFLASTSWLNLLTQLSLILLNLSFARLICLAIYKLNSIQQMSYRFVFTKIWLFLRNSKDSFIGFNVTMMTTMALALVHIFLAAFSLFPEKLPLPKGFFLTNQFEHCIILQWLFIAVQIVIVVARNIEFKQAEDALSKQIVLQRKLTSSISHEIRTPLNTAFIGLDLLTDALQRLDQEHLDGEEEEEEHAGEAGVAVVEEESDEDCAVVSGVQTPRKEEEVNSEPAAPFFKTPTLLSQTPLSFSTANNSTMPNSARSDSTYNTSNASSFSSAANRFSTASSRRGNRANNKLRVNNLLDIAASVKEGCEVSLGILNQLLTFEKLSAGMMKLECKVLPAVQVLQNNVKMFALQAQHKHVYFKLQTNFSNQEVLLYADEEKINQVVRNLLSNAMKFTPSYGSVRLLLEHVPNTNKRSPNHAKQLPPSEDKQKVNVIEGDSEQDVKCYPNPSPQEGQGGYGIASSNPGELLDQNFHYQELPQHKTRPNGYIRLSIEDSGPGVSAEDQTKLFQEYVQISPGELQKGQGTGLGLSISKSIIQLHGGFIGMTSQGRGKGSTFYIELPAYRKSNSVPQMAKTDISTMLALSFLKNESQGANKLTSSLSTPCAAFSPVDFGVPASSTTGLFHGEGTAVDKQEDNSPSFNSLLTPRKPSSHLNPLTILLVDDSVLTRKLLRQFLLLDGHTVYEAGSGKEALAVYEIVSSSSNVDLVLTDYLMPGEYNGLDTARLLRIKYGYQGITMLVTGLVESSNCDTWLEQAMLPIATSEDHSKENTRAAVDMVMYKPVKAQQIYQHYQGQLKLQAKQ